MNTYKITCSNGNTWTTGMNADVEEARAYFIGQSFTREHEDGLEFVDTVVGVSLVRDAPVIAFCKFCKSTNTTHDALVRWSVAAQDWEMSGTLDNCDCDACGESDCIEFRPCEPEELCGVDINPVTGERWSLDDMRAALADILAFWKNSTDDDVPGELFDRAHRAIGVKTGEGL